jgi:transcriptional regulator
LIENPHEIENILISTVNYQESKFENSWKYDLPESFKSQLTKAIVGFEIEITSIEGKFKLSQNRSESDQRGVLKGLSTRTDEMSRKVRDLMEGNSVWKSK